MTTFDPIIGQTSTKVGETYSTKNHQSHDPVVGTTATKVGETYTQTSGYGSGFGSSYYYSRPRTYSHMHSDGCSLVIAGILTIGIALFAVALSSSGSSSSYRRPHYNLFARPRSNYFHSNLYSGSSNLFNSFGQWGSHRKCDIIEICNQHLSGRKSGCYTTEQNCRWV
ncbi:MAG: hypothetical protein S4CHLAM6_11810 [Chlamydiae bacterium]|nr:hypothetical protein [Chlamydiota bacterium]